MATIGDLVTRLTVDSRPFTSGLNKSRRGLSSFADHARKAFVGITAASAAAGVGLGIMAVKLAASAEQTAISLEVMTGSAATAGKLIQDLRTMGAKTPFEFTDLADSTKTLLNFGRTNEQVLGDLDMLSNVAAGNAQKLQSLALVYGQIAANQKLMGGDLLQLINVGFNPLNNIAAKTGETMAELRDRMSRGKIGFEEVRQAFVDATSAGGLFYQMNEKQSKTLLGQWSTMKDELTASLIQIGESLVKNLDLKGLTGGLTETAAVFKRDWIPALEEFVKLAPDLIDAFGNVGKGVRDIAEYIRNVKDDVEGFSLILASIATRDPKGIAESYKEMQAAKVRADAKRDAVISPELMKPLQAHRDAIAGIGAETERLMSLKPDVIEIEEPRIDMTGVPAYTGDKTMNDLRKLTSTLRPGKHEAGQMLGRFITDGLAAMETGLMSLGPQAKTFGPAPQLGTLEKNSAEYFDVMRANVGQGAKDLQKDALQESKKQTKLLEKIVNKKPEGGGQTVLVKGFD